MVEDKAMAALREVHDPLVGDDVVSLGWVRRVAAEEAADGAVSFELALDTLALPHKGRLMQECERAVHEATGRPARGSMAAKLPIARRRLRDDDGLGNVAAIVAVSSCKGGTGKSTVAVNLAFALRAMGGRVGILDADLYGPSLPAMVSPEDDGVYRHDDGLVNAVQYEGVSCMSYGWVAGMNDGADGGAAVMRGPMASSIAGQLASYTNWGPLDFLILDLPPGTGDINLTLCQQLPIAAAVVVTTPHRLSYLDVVKGIEMFDKLKVPTIALVENMAYFTCEHGTEHRPFGPGFSAELVERYGFPKAFEFPISQRAAEITASGRPVVVEEPASDVGLEFHDLAASVVIEVTKLRHGAGARTTTSVSYNKDIGKVIVRKFTSDGGTEHQISPRELRMQCRCAACVDEFSGEPLIEEESVPADVVPVSVETRGNYAVAVAWSDGHDSSIYPYDQLERLSNA